MPIEVLVLVFGILMLIGGTIVTNHWLSLKKPREADEEIRRLTGGRGVDVTLEVIGLQETMEQAVQSLAILGRAVLAGIADRPFQIDSYGELLGREAEVIGSSDHLLHEMPLLLELARRGSLDLSRVVTRTVPLEAGPINEVMDALERFGGAVRTVITP